MRIFAAIGVLWGLGTILPSFFGSGSAWRGIGGVVFMIIAGYWIVASDKAPRASE